MKLDLLTEEEPTVTGIGFVAPSSKGGSGSSSKHEHEYNPFPGSSPYHKRATPDVSYMHLGCRCGGTIEVIVEDRR